MGGLNPNLQHESGTRGQGQDGLREGWPVSRGTSPDGGEDRALGETIAKLLKRKDRRAGGEGGFMKPDSRNSSFDKDFGRKHGRRGHLGSCCLFIFTWSLLDRTCTRSPSIWNTIWHMNCYTCLKRGRPQAVRHAGKVTCAPMRRGTTLVLSTDVLYRLICECRPVQALVEPAGMPLRVWSWRSPSGEAWHAQVGAPDAWRTQGAQDRARQRDQEGPWAQVVEAVMVRYPVAFERDGESVLVSFPDFPEAHTFGDDEDEALARAEDALLTVLDAYIRDRQDIPVPSRARGPQVALSGLVSAKLGLYGAMRASGIGKAELARRLGCHLPQVDRLLDLGHASRLEQLEQALQAIGRRLAVTVVPAHTPARSTRRRPGSATRSRSTRSRRLPARP